MLRRGAIAHGFKITGKMPVLRGQNPARGSYSLSIQHSGEGLYPIAGGSVKARAGLSLGYNPRYFLL